MSRYNAEANEINNDVGQNLGIIRLAKGLSMTTVGGYIGVSHQQFAKYESGENKIALCKAVILARELGVSIGDLVDESEPSSRGNVGEINKHLSALGEEAVFLVLQSVRGLRNCLSKG